jgi:hypothetical protein
MCGFFWPKIALLKLQCGKTYCPDAESAHPAKDLVSINECDVLNFPELKGQFALSAV